MKTTAPISTPAPRAPERRRRSRAVWRVLAVLLAIALLGSGAVATNALGAGHLFARAMAHVSLWLDPPPDRPTLATVEMPDVPDPATAAPAAPSATPSPPSSPGSSPTASASPSPSPSPVPVDVNLVSEPGAPFITEIENTWCAPAGTTIALAIMGKADNSKAFETRLAGQIDQWQSYSDSHDGGWGPAAIALALEAYGAPGYEVRAYPSLAAELRDAAAAIATTHAPVVLMAWRGAHTWVMTGYRATGDPTVFRNASITGAYIQDPWYPRVSTIWGRSAAPGAFHDIPNMKANILPWKRPEGRYADRDGKFIAVVPTMPVAGS